MDWIMRCDMSITTCVCVCVCVHSCWADNWSYWGFLQWCHSRRYWLTATQAWLHAYCLFTRTFRCPQFAGQFADNTVLSTESNTQYCQFHVPELNDLNIYWLRPSNSTHGRLSCSALLSWHCALRSCYTPTVSRFCRLFYISHFRWTWFGKKFCIMNVESG